MTLNSQDVFVEQIYVAHNWAPIRTGIRVTHIPTGISVTETNGRSAHRNRAVAWEKLEQTIQRLGTQ